MKPYRSVFEGGDSDDDAPKEDKPMTRTEKKCAKYKDAMDKFSVTDSGCTDDLPLNKNRSCNDIFCLLLFLAFLGTMGGCTYYGIANGDVPKMMAPYDYKNRFCGFGELKEYDNLYFTKLDFDANERVVLSLFSNAVCVKDCPKNAGDPIECADNDSLCEGIETFKTLDLLNYCIPRGMTTEQKSNFKEGYFRMLESNPFGQQLIEIYNCATALSLSMLNAFLLSMIYLWAVSTFAECLAWSMIWLTGIGLLVATSCGWYSVVDPEMFGVTNMEPSLLIVISSVLSLVTLVYFLMVFCGYDQLKTAIDVVDAAADFLHNTKKIIGLSFMFLIVTGIILMVWIFAIACIMSMGHITADPNAIPGVFTPQYRTLTTEDGEHKQTLYLLLFMLFGLFWIVNFIQYKTGFITMVAASDYYFKSTPEEEGVADVSWAVRTTYAYHLGSIAFASLIIAIINFIQFLFEAAAEKAAAASGENGAVKCIICVGRALLKCLECVADYINQCAFSFSAVSGENFCTGCYNGLLLNLKYGLEFAWSQTLAAGFVKLGKVAIVLLNTFIAYMLMKYVTMDLENEYANVITPLAVVAILSYITVDIFLGQFDEAVQALLTCLCVDRDLNGEDNIKWGPPTFHDGLKKAHDSTAARNAAKGTKYQPIN